MVIGMVTFMSMFGLVMNGEISTITIATYFNTWITNFIMALPLQLILVGPFSRFILGMVQNSNR